MATMFACVTFLQLTLSLHPAQTALAEYPETAERFERFLGIGWGDGYHACRSSGVRPFSDCPPRSYASQNNTALQRLRGCDAGSLSANFYDRFDANCRSNTVGNGLAGKIVYPFSPHEDSACDGCTPIRFGNGDAFVGPELFLEPALQPAPTTRAPAPISTPSSVFKMPMESLLEPDVEQSPAKVTDQEDADEAILSPSDKTTPTDVGKPSPAPASEDDSDPNSKASEETTITNLLPTQLPSDWATFAEPPSSAQAESPVAQPSPEPSPNTPEKTNPAVRLDEPVQLDEPDVTEESVEDIDRLLEEEEDALEESLLGQSRWPTSQDAPATRVYSRRLFRLPPTQPNASPQTNLPLWQNDSTSRRNPASRPRRLPTASSTDADLTSLPHRQAEQELGSVLTPMTPHRLLVPPNDRNANLTIRQPH